MKKGRIIIISAVVILILALGGFFGGKYYLKYHNEKVATENAKIGVKLLDISMEKIQESRNWGQAVLDSYHAQVEAEKQAAYEAALKAYGEQRASYMATVPRKGWFVEVSEQDQKTFVYNNGQVLQEFLCSTGTANHPTPKGKFTISGRGYSFDGDLDDVEYTCYYWTAFTPDGEYLFHSVPCWRDGTTIPGAQAMLGQPASHGCIRLDYNNALWFYNNVPSGTTVHVH